MSTPLFSLTDGTTNLPLVYAPANAHTYQVLYGIKVAPTESRPAWHSPDESPEELLNLTDGNRQGFFEMNAGTAGSGDDDIQLNDLITLRRWIDGANQQAARHQTHDQEVSRIYLKIQRKYSSVATLHPVIYGFVDDGSAQYHAVGEINSLAYKVGVMLVLAPYGEAEDETTLYNHVPNPALYFEGATSGLAAQWSTNGTVTPTLDTDTYLIHGQSQKLVGAANGDGIVSDAFSMATTSGYGYAWIHVVAGTVNIWLVDSTATTTPITTTIDSTDSGGISDKTYTDPRGAVWYRVPLVSVNGLVSGNDHKIRFRQNGATPATWFVGMTYFQLGATAVPDMWSSGALIENRNDQTTTDPEQINHVDIWGVPGDVDGLIDFDIDPVATGGTELFAIGTFRDKRDQLAAAFPHWKDGTNLSTDSAKTTGGSFVNTVVAGTSLGSVARFTSSNATNEGHKIISVYSRTPLTVYVRAKAGQVGATMTLETTTNGGPSPLHDVQSVTLSSSQYRMHRLGTIYRTTPEGTGSPNSSCNIKVVCADTGQTIDIDAVLLLPTRDGNLLYQTTTGDLATGSMGGGNTNLYASGIEQRSWLTEEIIPVGTYPTAAAGNTITRFYFNRLEDDTGTRHYLTDTFAVTIKILPRTRHLLGTL